MHRLLPLLLLTLLLFGCVSRQRPDPRDTITLYERLVQAMKPDSIARLFTQNAEVGHAGQPSIKGRDSIFRFLSSFSTFHVLSNRDSITSMQERHDSAVAAGVYRQTVVVPSGDTVRVAGFFEATLVADPAGHWLIARMRTRSY